MNSISTTLRLAALAVGLASTAAHAGSPVGVWIDHTGRGAVEIAECGGGLCGHVVWVKDAKNAKACRDQIIGNVKSVGPNTWDRGWIVDPDDNARYSVELKPVGEDRLRVTGYMGSKLFSETMTWKRAPADMKRCDAKDAAMPVSAPAAPAIVAPPADAAPAPLQREVSAPVIAPAAPAAPVVETAPSVPDRVAVAEPAPAPAVETPPQPERRAQRQTKRKSASRDCKLDLPYVTVDICNF
jgi:uncharacterized protein (DUF2147 family)